MAITNRKIESKALTIGELFQRPVFYRVPVYQRNFAWTSEEVEAFLDDVTTAIESGKTEYFLGAVVVSQTDDEKVRDIVDGQQRLTAASMLFSAIAGRWRALDDDRRAIGVERDFLCTEDRRSRQKIAKLTLNEINDPFFQQLVVQGTEPNEAERKLWAHSNRLLVDAYVRIKRHVDGFAGDSSDQESNLLDLEAFIAEKVYVILIEAGDESDAFTTFETLNDRGLDLAIADLVKNFLFSRADRHIGQFKAYWAEIMLLVGGENLTQFLRYFWNSQYATSRESDLYKSIKGVIKSDNAAGLMMERLRKASDLYAALNNVHHTYWSDYPNEYRGHLEALSLFRVTQYRPIALAAMEKFDPEKMTKLLRMLVVFSFRYTVISALNTGNLDKVYSKTALAISDGSLRGLRDVFESLRTVYVDDDRFESDFQHKPFTKDDVARYVLAEINTCLEKDRERVPADREGRLSLEHVLPKNAKDEWSGAVPEDRDVAEFVYRIGNLTLLEKGKNRGIGNASFRQKREKAFATSSLIINSDLAAASSWSHVDIEERSRQLARVARSIWRLDF